MNVCAVRYAISDRNGAHDPVVQAAALAKDTIDFFQLREKDLTAGELAELARRVLRALARSQTRLIINARADVALATGAHGVHLTSSPEELNAVQVHHLYAEAGKTAPLISISCHSLEDVWRVSKQPVTAVLFGPVFDKTVRGKKIAVGTGLTRLREACRIAAPVPVFALGGVTERNAWACLEAGVAGIAGIRLFNN